MRYGLILVILAIAGCSNEREGALSVEPYNDVLMRSALDKEIGNEIQMREILFAPGWKAPRHYHNSDLFIYVISGEFEVDMEGSGLITYTKPNTPMDARNSSADRPLKLAVFQVGNPDLPFVVPVDELVE
jgi:quercetin dioxygenase-like cupin family protein